MCSMLFQLVNIIEGIFFLAVDGVSHLLIKLQYIKRKLFDDNTKTCETLLSVIFLFYGA